MSDITQILNAIDAGDSHAAEQLLPLVYDELRKFAAQKLAHEKPGQTLQATALVHEAYLRLVHAPPSKSPGAKVAGRAYFFAAAAEAMRRILIERARQKRGPKRGGGRKRVDLSDVVAAADEFPNDLLDLDAALARLTVEDSIAGKIAKLRVFAGLSVEEAAQALDLSRASAYRHWTYARAWLGEALG